MRERKTGVHSRCAIEKRRNQPTDEADLNQNFHKLATTPTDKHPIMRNSSFFRFMSMRELSQVQIVESRFHLSRLFGPFKCVDSPQCVCLSLFTHLFA